MNLWLAIGAAIAGVALVVSFSGKLVQGAVGVSRGFGLSAFPVSVIFIGFDPENLAVGAAGSYEQMGGIALGSIVGAAMVALALAFGITALLAPMTFAKAPKPVLAVPIVAAGLFSALAWDGSLSRVDGALLLASYLLSVCWLVWLRIKTE